MGGDRSFQLRNKPRRACKRSAGCAKTDIQIQSFMICRGSGTVDRAETLTPFCPSDPRWLNAAIQTSRVAPVGAPQDAQRTTFRFNHS